MTLGIKYERAQRTANPACFRGGITSHGPIEPMPMPSIWQRLFNREHRSKSNG
jgi:hypothetical protein